jgi:hypothetical protein
MPQPLFEVTLTRPWHWGIAVVFDHDGEVPDVDPEQLVSVGTSGLVILVRHAQDSIKSFDGDWDWATACLHVRLLTAAEPTERSIACDTVLQTPSGRLSVGDADGDVALSTHHHRTRVVVSVEDPADTSPDKVWIDLLPVDS